VSSGSSGGKSALSGAMPMAAREASASIKFVFEARNQDRATGPGVEP